jgi:multiple sugar transport system substrate-binding protein
MAAALAAAWGCGSGGGGESSGEPPEPEGTAPPTEQPGPSGQGPITIRFLRHENPNYVKADQAYFNAYMAAHPNVTIVDTTVDFATLWSTLLGDLRRDQFAYDLVLIPPSRVCGFAENITDVPDNVITLSEAQNTFFDAPLDGSVCADKLKGLPVEYNLEYGGVVVNVDKYQAKFPGKTPSWATWDEFIAEASQLTEYDEGGVPRASGLDIDPDWQEAVKHIFLSQILQRGGDYWAADGITFNFDTPEARATMTEMASWITEDKVMYTNLVPDRNTHVTTRLAAGAAGFGWDDPAKPLSVMGYVGTAGVPSTVAQLPAGVTWHYDYFPVPPMVGTEHKFVQNSGWAFVVPRTSRYPQVAWDIAKGLALSPEEMRKWSATTGALPALRVNGTPGAAANDPTLAKVQPLLELGQWIGYIPNPAHETVGGAIMLNYFAVVDGTKTVDQALADMQKTANDAILQYQGQ